MAIAPYSVGSMIDIRTIHSKFKHFLKVHNVFPKVTFPTWLHPGKYGFTPKFQIVYAGPTNLSQHSTTDLAKGIMTNERTQSVLSKAQSFKHFKTTSRFFVFIFHQRAGNTSLFHMRGVDFTHFNICCT